MNFRFNRKPLKEKIYKWYVCGYYDINARAVEDNLTTNDVEEAKDFAWELVNRGDFVIVKNMHNGKSAIINEDDVFDDVSEYLNDIFRSIDGRTNESLKEKVGDLNEMARIVTEEDDELAYQIFDDGYFRDLVYQILYNSRHKIKSKYNGTSFEFDYGDIKESIIEALREYGDVEIDESTLTHAHGIGNNNEWKIYRRETGKKVYIGYVYITIGVYGGYYCGIEDINKKLIPSTKCRIGVRNYNGSPKIFVESCRPTKNESLKEGLKEGSPYGRPGDSEFVTVAFDDGIRITARTEEEAINAYRKQFGNIDGNPQIVKDAPARSAKELDKIAMSIYNSQDGDDDRWYDFTDEELAILWSMCMLTDENPWGKAYDDEVYDAINSIPYGRKIFKRADEILDNQLKVDESLKEDISDNDIDKVYKKLSKLNKVDFGKLEDEYLKTRPSLKDAVYKFYGTILNTKSYCKDFVQWAKEEKGIDLKGLPCRKKNESIKEDLLPDEVYNTLTRNAKKTYVVSARDRAPYHYEINTEYGIYTKVPNGEGFLAHWFLDSKPQDTVEDMEYVAKKYIDKYDCEKVSVQEYKKIVNGRRI